MVPKYPKAPRTTDLGYDYYLPSIECLTCQPEWRTWSACFEYPALQFDFLNKNEYNSDRALGVKDFNSFVRRITQIVGRPINLIAGGGLGKLSGYAVKPLKSDFHWGRIRYPQISRTACDLLANEGIELLTAECDIRLRGKRIESHLALQIEPFAVLTEEGRRKLSIEICPICGNFELPNPASTSAKIVAEIPLKEKYLIDQKAWPKGQHLIKMIETLDILVSEEFIEAVRKRKLNDVLFEECGRIV